MFLDEILGVAVYVDYKIKKLMEKEIAKLRLIQEKLCCALLERDKLVKSLEGDKKKLTEQLEQIKIERDILKEKLELEREYARIMGELDENKLTVS